MKSTRKGLGRGKGKGYTNIIRTDPVVHSNSAKGRKTYSNPVARRMEKNVANRMHNLINKVAKIQNWKEEYIEEVQESQLTPYMEDTETGRKYKRLRYGHEIKVKWKPFYCGDCGVPKGFYHAYGCDVEENPVPPYRGEQLLGTPENIQYSK